ncbi:MAG: hypothetical protein WC545_02630 [Patescibacteria group bacterium]
MTNNELISKLNNLKNVNPGASWKKSNRDLLLAQISNSGAEELSTWKIFVINFESVLKAAVRPVSALGVFVLLLLGGASSYQIFAQAKPNDSLYIARVISEKVKLNTVVNTQERDKLAARFASNHARDISAILANPEFNNEENQDQVAKLSESFNKEVDTVKDRINRISRADAPVASETEEEKEGEAEIIIADSFKDDSGIQLAEAETPVAEILETETEIEVEAEKDEAVALEIKKDEAAEVLADEGADAASKEAASALLKNLAIEAEEKAADADNVAIEKILNEAKELFDNKEYDGVLEKLQALGELIK